MSARKASQLIDDLLEFSRMGQTDLRYADVDLNQLVQDTIRRLEPDTRGRSIRWTLGTLPTVRGDRAMLEQVFVNLLGNAIKYTGKRADAEITIGHSADKHSTVLYVRDNGVGFDMNYAERLFGVFQRLHSEKEFEGTGIGLANVRRIVTRHGGRTWAESKVGEGATFYVLLPNTVGFVPPASSDSGVSTTGQATAIDPKNEP